MVDLFDNKLAFKRLIVIDHVAILTARSLLRNLLTH